MTLVCPTLAKDPSFRSKVRTIEWFMVRLALASLLVYLRTLFRLGETAQGLFGSMSTNETFFGNVEFAPVVVVIWVMAVWHLGRWLSHGVGADPQLFRMIVGEARSKKENSRSDV